MFKYIGSYATIVNTSLNKNIKPPLNISCYFHLYTDTNSITPYISFIPFCSITSLYQIAMNVIPDSAIMYHCTRMIYANRKMHGGPRMNYGNGKTQDGPGMNYGNWKMYDVKHINALHVELPQSLYLLYEMGNLLVVVGLMYLPDKWIKLQLQDTRNIQWLTVKLVIFISYYMVRYNALL